MNKRDYELVAACIGRAYRDATGNTEKSNGIWDLKRRLELEFSLDNPRFDKNKFSARIQYHEELE